MEAEAGPGNAAGRAGLRMTSMTIALLQSTGNSAAALFVQVLPILAIGLVFYFLVIAPANKQRRKTESMLSSLKKGDRVLTSGGIYGTIQGVEAEVVYLKIADNVKIKLARSAVTSIVTGEAE
jgi:preprotein translocase subunit YajC